MCNKHNSVWINLKNKKFRVDACIRDLIYYLNCKGVETLACCCGHGKYPITIVYRHKEDDALKGNLYDLLSGWGILGRKKRYYKKDAQGIYFIPEVLQNDKRVFGKPFR